MNTQEVYAAIDNGHSTIEEIAAAVDHHYGHVGRVLKQMHEDGDLERWKDGHTVHYGKPDPEAEPEVGSDLGDTLAPVARDYEDEFARRVPTGVKYVPTDGELDELKASIDAAHALDEPVRAMVSAPTGAGKTTLAEYVAQTYDAPMFTLQMNYLMSEADLIGSPTYVGDAGTMWVDGALTKALIASQDGRAVLLVDEVNRARPEGKASLFGALDHRATVTLDGPRGGEVIEGDPNNLIVIATMNEGDDYNVADPDMDLAERRRYTEWFDIDYLTPAKERDLLVDRTGIHKPLAELMVKAGNDIRDLADENGTDIKRGLPTSAMLAWAAKSRGYHMAGLDDPIMRAAHKTIVRPFYDTEAARNTATQTIEAHVGDAPMDEDDFEGWAADTKIVCGSASCEWEIPETKEDEYESLAYGECPECSEPVRTVGN